MSSESQARENIDHLLTQSGWHVCDADKANIHASLGGMSTQSWQWAALEDVATVTAGNPAPQGEEFFAGGTHPFVRVQDLGRLKFTHLTDTADHVNDKASKSLKQFPKGSILFTKSGASLLLNQRAILGRDMHVVKSGNWVLLRILKGH